MLPQLISVLALAAVASSAATKAVPPSLRGAWHTAPLALNSTRSVTDTASIVSTVHKVRQKGTANGLPNQAINKTAITAVDGKIITSTSGSHTIQPISPLKRDAYPLGSVSRRYSAYQQVFAGTGTGLTARDASIEGTAYLTYTTVPNSTYNVDACLSFCDSVPTCVFANIFYEFNNPGLNAGSSNLKCAIYSDTHTAVEKTNFGGQQQAPPPAGLTYIQQSSGYSKATLVSPDTPEGYELVFGPTNGANNAPGYMGFVFLDRYDVDACADQCNTRGADGQGGACQYFNIWRAVVSGTPTTYTCSMYYIVADASTAVNTGQGTLQVTFSRGYSRKNLAIDGGFEGYKACSLFCFDESYTYWVGTSPVGGSFDASIFFYQPYAHAGNAVALLGSADGSDALSGTLTARTPLKTVAGKHYSIGFFHASTFSTPTEEAGAFVDVKWNGATVATIHPGYSDWKFFQFSVTGAGHDVLSFHGGAAPAWSFLDDISVFQV